MASRSIRRHRLGFVVTAALLVVPGIGLAADLFEPGTSFDTRFPTARYFPRGDGSENDATLHPPFRRIAGCLPRQARVPTNAPDDPSYVGSEYGLGKPSYYGFTPPRGVDDPFGRSLLPYCR